jgi:FAD:protein FMN transferase
MLWKKFKALGTEITFSARLEEKQARILAEAEMLVRDFETRFSRFIQGNELDILKSQILPEYEVSEMLADLLQEAKKFYLETNGIFDPTIIGALTAIGYDQSFEKLEPTNKASADITGIQSQHASRSRFDELRIVGKTVSCPEKISLDLGGIGKGYILDKLEKNLFQDLQDFWISAGGDLIVKGNSEEQTGWEIGVQNPLDPDKNIFKIKTSGEKLAIATSGVISRKGRQRNFNWNHIIDPRSGLPVNNDILAVTVISSSAVQADVYAKTVLILGQEQGLDFIEQKNDSAGIIFLRENEPIISRQAIKYINNI